MTYEELKKANSLIKTIPIQGKEYAQVPERLNAFRSVFPEGMILTELISYENGVVVMKATVYSDQGKVLATGHAYEREGSSFINKTSAIENCETSAVGRALGNAGFGSEASIASAEEVLNAINNQNQYKPEPNEQLPWETGEQTGPICSDCGQVIQARKTRKGEMWQADSIGNYTERKFGRKLCVDCMKKAEKEAE